MWYNITEYYGRIFVKPAMLHDLTYISTNYYKMQDGELSFEINLMLVLLH